MTIQSKYKRHYLNSPPTSLLRRYSPCGREHTIDDPTTYTIQLSEVTCKTCLSLIAANRDKHVTKRTPTVKKKTPTKPVKHLSAFDSLDGLYQKTIGDTTSGLCLKLSVEVEIEVEALLDAEDAFSEAVEGLTQYGSVTIVDSAVVKKEW